MLIHLKKYRCSKRSDFIDWRWKIKIIIWETEEKRTPGALLSLLVSTIKLKCYLFIHQLPRDIAMAIVLKSFNGFWSIEQKFLQRTDYAFILKYLDIIVQSKTNLKRRKKLELSLLKFGRESSEIFRSRWNSV